MSLQSKFSAYAEDRGRGLIIYYLFFDGFGNNSPFILLVAQLRFKACFFNSILDGAISKTMRGTCGTHHIFFNHDGTKIVGACMQAELRCLFANGEPGSLDVFDVRQHDAADGDHPDVFFRRGQVMYTADPGEQGIHILEGPWNKSKET